MTKVSKISQNSSNSSTPTSFGVDNSGQMTLVDTDLSFTSVKFFSFLFNYFVTWGYLCQIVGLLVAYSWYMFNVQNFKSFKHLIYVDEVYEHVIFNTFVFLCQLFNYQFGVTLDLDSGFPQV